MAGTEHRGEQGRRRFITRHHVEDAAAAGQPIRVQGRDVVTDEAAQRAADLGVLIERDGTVSGSAAMTSSRVASPTAPSATPATGAAVASSDADLRRVIRAAVVAELGAEPAGLDAVIDRVLKARSR